MLKGTVDNEKPRAIAKAMARIAECWGLNEDAFGDLLSLLPTQDIRIADRISDFAEGSEAAKRAGQILRLFVALDCLFDDDRAAGQWLQVWNADLRSRPLDEMRSREGIAAICEYVESFVQRS